jgi:hypothetical protein
LWIDDVRVYGMYLHPDEKVHLLGQMFLAKEQMRKGDFTLADYLLESFWACFLSTYMAPAPAAEASGKPAGQEPAAAEEKITRRPGRASPTWRENLRHRWQR